MSKNIGVFRLTLDIIKFNRIDFNKLMINKINLYLNIFK